MQMIRPLTVFAAALTGAAAPAFAHPGHIAGLAGHDHWVAGAAIGAAVAIGVWSVLKGRRKTKPKSDTVDKPQTQES